jgi:hypothetical protein
MSIKPLSILSLNKGVFTASTKVFNAKTDSALTSKKSTEKTADTVPIDLKNKPKGTNTGEYLLRESLNKVSSKYGFNSSDIELEIVTRRQNKTGFSKNHDNYTDEQLAKDIKSGNTKIDFSINQSTIDKMKERKIVLQVVAEKEAFGGNLSEKDISELSELGYNAQDISNLRNVKFMEYGGHQAEFIQKNKEQFQNLNNELRQKMVNDELAKLQTKPEEDFYNEGNEKINPDFERRRIANEIVNKELDGKTPFEYLRNKKDEEAFEKRLSEKSNWDYLSNGSKNFLNGVTRSVGESLKGVAVLANGLRQYDDEGNKLDSKASEAPIYKAGDWLQKESQLSTDKDIDRTLFGGTVPKTVGTVLPYVLGGWATATPKATTAVLAGLSTGGAVYDEAIANDATETEAQKTALLTGGFVGVATLGGYGKTLETLNKGVGSTVWKDVFAKAVKEGGRNAVVAGVQTVGENAIAKGIYDKDRNYLDNVRERMVAAGITGAALTTGVQIIGNIRAGKNLQILAKTQRNFGISKEKINAKVGDLQNNASLAKAKLQNKANEVIQKVKVTDAEAIQAKKVIREYAKNQPLYSSIYLGTVEPKLANAYRKVGQKAIQDGYTNFKEFSGEMVKTVGAKVKPHLTKLFSEVSNENVFKANKSEIEVFKTKESELKAKFESIEEFRKTNKLPEFAMQRNLQGEKTGTTSFVELGDEKIFGTSTKILDTEKTNAINQQRLLEKRTLGKETLNELQTTLGKLKNEKYGMGKGEFLSHAESESLIRTAQKYKNEIIGKELKIYVDRLTCNKCQDGLPLLVELYKLKKVTIYDAYGHMYEVTKGGTNKIH